LTRLRIPSESRTAAGLRDQSRRGHRRLRPTGIWQRMSELFLAQIFALLTALGFASSDVAARYGLRTSTPVSAILMMAVLTLLLYAPAAAATFRWEALNAKGVFVFLVAGVAAPGAAAMFHYKSFQTIGLARTVSIVGCAPLITVVLAVL